MSLYHDMSEFIHDESKQLFFVPFLLVRVRVLSCDAEYIADFAGKPRDVLIEHFVLFLVPFRRLVKCPAIHRHGIRVLALVIKPARQKLQKGLYILIQLYDLMKK